MSNNKLTNYNIFSKSNYKTLKVIIIILSTLILICLILLVVGFINKFNKLSKTNAANQDYKYEELRLSYPKGSDLYSVKLNDMNNLMLWYKKTNENFVIIIDLKDKKIINKLSFKKSDLWKLE